MMMIVSVCYSQVVPMNVLKSKFPDERSKNYL